VHLSIVIDRGLKNYKVTDSRKQYPLWICWLRKIPPAKPSPVASPEIPTPITRKKSVRKEVKKEPREPSLPSLPSTLTPAVTAPPKRPRIVSFELSAPPRPPKLNGIVKTRMQEERKAQQALGGDAERGLRIGWRR
jgi:hypothetical protein